MQVVLPSQLLLCSTRPCSVLLLHQVRKIPRQELFIAEEGSVELDLIEEFGTGVWFSASRDSPDYSLRRSFPYNNPRRSHQPRGVPAGGDEHKEELAEHYCGSKWPPPQESPDFHFERVQIRSYFHPTTPISRCY